MNIIYSNSYLYEEFKIYMQRYERQINSFHISCISQEVVQSFFGVVYIFLSSSKEIDHFLHYTSSTQFVLILTIDFESEEKDKFIKTILSNESYKNITIIEISHIIDCSHSLVNDMILTRYFANNKVYPFKKNNFISMYDVCRGLISLENENRELLYLQRHIVIKNSEDISTNEIKEIIIKRTEDYCGEIIVDNSLSNNEVRHGIYELILDNLTAAGTCIINKVDSTIHSLNKKNKIIIIEIGKDECIKLCWDYTTDLDIKSQFKIDANPSRMIIEKLHSHNFIDFNEIKCVVILYKDNFSPTSQQEIQNNLEKAITLPLLVISDITINQIKSYLNKVLALDSSKKTITEYSDPNNTTYLNCEAVRKHNMQLAFSDDCLDSRNSILADFISDRKSMFIVDPVIKMQDKVNQYISDNSLNAICYEIPSQESDKNWSTVINCINLAIEMAIPRNGFIVGIGGGAILDTVGTFASIYRRGIPYIRIPTTLLSQIDAGIGVKVGINYGNKKNLLGGFYPSVLTICDTKFLDTLHKREITSGLAEIIKVSIISNESLFRKMESFDDNLLDFNDKKKFIMDSAKECLLHLKKDFFETDLWRHLDFGHVIAHGIEGLTNYRITHGQAVAIDILFSSYISLQRGILDKVSFDRILKLHTKLNILFCPEELTQDACWQLLEESKAHKAGRLKMVVPTSIGSSLFIEHLFRDEVAAAIDFLSSMQNNKNRNQNE